MPHQYLVVARHPATLVGNYPALSRALGPFSGKLDNDDDVRAIVLMGAGKNFSSGIDLLASINLIPQGGEGPDIELITCHNFLLEIQHKFQVVDRCKKPVIAAVHGACLGAGLDLIATCDIRIASEDAYFCLKEVRIAMVSDLGSLQRLPKIIGDGMTRELAYTARDFDAKEAKEFNLLNKITPDKESCHQAAMEMAKAIAVNAPLAVQATKQAMNYSRDKSINDGLEYAASRNAQLIRSADVKEAFMSMAQKRPPDFKGK